MNKYENIFFIHLYLLAQLNSCFKYKKGVRKIGDTKNFNLIVDNGFLSFIPTANQFLSARSQPVPLSDCGIDSHLHVIRVVLYSIG